MLRSVHSLTLITRIEAYPDLEQKDINALKAAVDQISPNYAALLARHRPGQRNRRVSVNLGGDSLHFMSGEEMLTDQRTRFGYNPHCLKTCSTWGDIGST